MKVLIIAILCGCIHFASSLNDGTFSQNCESQKDCKSQQCTPICDSTNNEKACTEPSWFYVRHLQEIPTCVPSEYLSRKITSSVFTNKRSIGQSCHNDRNCLSLHCLPSCESSSTVWNCVEKRSFFERQNLDLPICASTNYVKVVEEPSPKISLHTEGSRRIEKVIEKEEQSPTISLDSEESKIVENHLSSMKSLGQSCSQHADCYSKNCISICESPRQEEESRCIEAEMSFAMYNLPTPKCLGREEMKNLVSSVDAGIEQVIWNRLALLRAKASNGTDKHQGKNKLEDIPKQDVSGASKNANGFDSWGDLYSSLRGGKQ